MVNEIGFSTLQNPKRTFEDYSLKFSNHHRPLTESEFSKIYNIAKSSFEQKYLPRMKALSFVLVIKKSKNTVRLLKKLYSLDWNSQVDTYYFLTPNTSKIIITLMETVKEFGKYLKNKDDLVYVVQKLSHMLKNYEILSNKSEQLLEWENKEYDLNGEDKLSFVPIHKHKTINGKVVPIPLNEKELENFNFFKIVSVKKDKRPISFKKAIKELKKGSTKKFEMNLMNEDTCKAITRLILTKKDNQTCFPASVTLLGLINGISYSLRYLTSSFNQNINFGEILDQKIKSTQTDIKLL